MFQVVQPPTAEPLSLQEARVHLNQGGDSPSASPSMYEVLPDDSWIKDKITAAREACEAFLGYPLTDALYRVTFSNFTGYQNSPWGEGWSAPDWLQLPHGFASVEAIAYLDDMNISRSLGMTSWTFDPVTRIVFPNGAWPVVSSRPEAVRLLARGGYGGDSPPLPVPQAVRHAMLLMIGEWYVNREESVDAKQGTAALGVEYLLRPLRMRLGMA